MSFCYSDAWGWGETIVCYIFNLVQENDNLFDSWKCNFRFMTALHFNCIPLTIVSETGGIEIHFFALFVWYFFRFFLFFINHWLSTFIVSRSHQRRISTYSFFYLQIFGVISSNSIYRIFVFFCLSFFVFETYIRFYYFCLSFFLSCWILFLSVIHLFQFLISIYFLSLFFYIRFHWKYLLSFFLSFLH